MKDTSHKASSHVSILQKKRTLVRLRMGNLQKITKFQMAQVKVVAMINQVNDIIKDRGMYSPKPNQYELRQR